METIEERIKKIEEEIRKTPYHKGTEHHIGKLRARIARLKEELLEKRTGGGGGGYAVRKTGDASVVLFGFPSVGKSTLINNLTNTQSKVAAYDFTTLEVIPGMMDYKGAKIQIFDVPGVLEGAAEGKGRGKQVISVVRSANLIIIMIDPETINKIDILKKELESAGIRLNQSPPKVTFVKTISGGLKINSSYSLPFSLETIKEVAHEFRIVNGEITIKEPVTLERLIDAIMGNRVYLPYLTVLNKADLLLIKDSKFDSIDLIISAEKNLGLEELRQAIWSKLGLARIYLKKEGCQPDMKNPFIIKLGESLDDILQRISICTKESFKKAKISGPGAKYPNQEVSLTFIPQDGAIVEFSA